MLEAFLINYLENSRRDWAQGQRQMPVPSFSYLATVCHTIKTRKNLWANHWHSTRLGCLVNKYTEVYIHDANRSSVMLRKVPKIEQVSGRPWNESINNSNDPNSTTAAISSSTRQLIQSTCLEGCHHAVPVSDDQECSLPQCFLLQSPEDITSSQKQHRSVNMVKGAKSSGKSHS